VLTASAWITTVAPAAALGAAVGLYGIISPRARIWGPVIARAKHPAGDNASRSPSTTAPPRKAPPRCSTPCSAWTRRPPSLSWVKTCVPTRTCLDACNDAVYDVIGQRPAFFRPPMGLKHWHLLKEVTWGGQTCVNWSRRARDGNTHQTPKRLIHRLTKRLSDGDICLLHDGHEPDHPGTRQHTADAIPALVNQIRDRGFELVRLDELLDQPGYLPTDHDHDAPKPTDDIILPTALENGRGG